MWVMSPALQDYKIVLFRLCFIVNSSWPRPKIARSAAGDPTWLPKEEQQPSSQALLLVAVVLNAGDWGRGQLTFLNHGLRLIFMTFCLCTLCHFSNFHSVGEEHHVMSPHVSFLLLPTTSFHCVNAPPFFPFSLHSLLYVERKVDVL